MNTLITTTMALALSLIPSTATNTEEVYKAQSNDMRQRYEIVSEDYSYSSQYDANAQNGVRQNATSRNSINSNKNGYSNNSNGETSGNRSNVNNSRIIQNGNNSRENTQPIRSYNNLTPRIRADVYIYFEGNDSIFNGYDFVNGNRKSQVNDAKHPSFAKQRSDGQIPQTLEMRDREYRISPEYPSRKNAQAWNGVDAYQNYSTTSRNANR